MKIGILNEKFPNQNIIFLPTDLEFIKLKFSNIIIKMMPSEYRCVSDKIYSDFGIEVTNEIDDCDIFFGITPPPFSELIPEKKYYFWDIKGVFEDKNTIEFLNKNKINLFDYKEIANKNSETNGFFEKHESIAAIYNALRAFGIKFELYKLPQIETITNFDLLTSQLKRIVLPSLKFTVIENFPLNSGIADVFKLLKIKEVNNNDFLNKNYTQCVFTFISTKNSEINITPFTKVSDFFILGNCNVKKNQVTLTPEMLNAKDCKIKIVSTITTNSLKEIDFCLQKTTLNQAFYGYLPATNTIADYFHPAAIVISAVNNLPAELPVHFRQAALQIALKEIVGK